jgi:cbb3-type cytochrome oxidase cytochrome c subunit
VAKSWEYNNELQRPVMFGTRRVGPDLSREAGRRGNDWHFIHFYRPRMTTPESVMPDYPWFFDGRAAAEVPTDDGGTQRVEGPAAPNKRGFAIITYMQWLGSWLDSYPHYQLAGGRDSPGELGPK